MNRLFAKVVLFMSVILASSNSANAQDIRNIIESLQTDQSLTEMKNSPLLFLFAREWDSEINTRRHRSMVEIRRYMNLMNPDEDLLRNGIEGLARSGEIREFFLSRGTEDAFDNAYREARRSRSSVGMIPRDRALRYWILSRLIFNERDFPQWCSPPFIRCR